MAQNEFNVNLTNEATPIGFILGAAGSTALGIGIFAFLGWTYWRYREFLTNYLRQWVRPRAQDSTVENPPHLHYAPPSSPPQSRAPPVFKPLIPHSKSASAAFMQRSATMSNIMYETPLYR
jgi:hypothetical protein